MPQKILIAYDTIHGSTSEVAARIGDQLCDMGFKFEFSWLPDAKAFLKNFNNTLAAKPTAVFIVCAGMAQDATDTLVLIQKSFIGPVLDNYSTIKPLSIGVLG